MPIPLGGGSALPQQALPRSKKDEAWKKASVEAIIGMSSFGNGGIRMTDIDDGLRWRDIAQKNYEFYNGIIDDEDYTHVTKPFGNTRGNLPSKLHNYPIIKPNVDLLLGEFSKRPRNYSVTVVNPDVVTRKAEAKKEAVLKNLKNLFVSNMEEAGLIPQDGGLAPQEPEKLDAEFERNYRDGRAILGQQALNYIEQTQEIERCFQEIFFHWLVSGFAFSKKSAKEGEVTYQVLNPVYTDYDKSPDIKFIEDGDWASTVQWKHLSRILDDFYDVLTPEEIRALERPASEITLIAPNTTQDSSGTGRLIEVVDVCWKSIKRVAVVTYFSEVTGQDEQYYAEEGDRIDDDHKAEWFWVNEVWEGTRIDGKLYKNVGPSAVQRSDMDNPSKCKLPINGRVYSDVNAPPISMVALSIPLQLTYNIYKYRLDNEIARAKGMIALLDIDLIPEEFGNGEDAIDTFFYYIEALGIAFQQRDKEGDNYSQSIQQVLDLTVKTIQQHLMLLESILNEWDMISGVSRQRKGAITQYDGKGTTEQSVIQSSHITEDMFAKIEQFFQREYAGLLDLSKTAFVGGKSAMFSMSDGRDAYLELDGMQHMETNYGVFVNGSSKENRKIEALRSLGEQMASTGQVPITLLAEIMESENFVQLKENIRKIEDLSKQAEQATQQAQQEMEAAKLKQAAEALAETSRQKDLDRQNKVEVALIQQDTTLKSAQLNAALTPEAPDNSSLEEMKHRDTVTLKNKELDLKRGLETRSLDLQKEKQDTDASLGKQELVIKKKVASKSATPSK